MFKYKDKLEFLNLNELNTWIRLHIFSFFPFFSLLQLDCNSVVVRKLFLWLQKYNLVLLAKYIFSADRDHDLSWFIVLLKVLGFSFFVFLLNILKKSAVNQILNSVIHLAPNLVYMKHNFSNTSPNSQVYKSI